MLVTSQLLMQTTKFYVFFDVHLCPPLLKKVPPPMAKTTCADRAFVWFTSCLRYLESHLLLTFTENCPSSVKLHVFWSKNFLMFCLLKSAHDGDCIIKSRLRLASCLCQNQAFLSPVIEQFQSPCTIFTLIAFLQNWLARSGNHLFKTLRQLKVKIVNSLRE